MQPASASKELVERVEGWRAAGVRNDVELQSIKRQAEALKSSPSDHAFAYMVLGMVACLKDDPQAMRSNHEKALMLEPTNLLLAANYATSLVASGFVQEALTQQRKSFEASGGDVEAISDYAGTLISSGRIQEARDLLRENAMEWVGRDDALKVAEVEAWATDLSDAGLSDEELQEGVELVFDVMHDMGYFFNSTVWDRSFDEVSSWVSFVVRPAGVDSVAKSMELNDRLIERLAGGAYPAFESGALVARFSCARSLNGN